MENIYKNSSVSTPIEIPDGTIVKNIKRAKNEWETTVDSLKQVILLVDNQGLICRGNRTIEYWHLGNVEKIKGKAIHELLHPECSNKQCYMISLWEFAEKKLLQNQIHELEAEDPILERFLRFEFRPMGFLKQGHKGMHNEAFALISVEDISCFKKTENELRRTASNLKAVLDSMPDQILMLAPDGTILYYSPGDLEDTTYSNYIKRGEKIQNTFPPTVGELFLKAINKVLQKKSKTKVNYQLASSNGLQLYEARYLPMMENNIIVFNRNITEQARLETIAQSVEMMNSFGYFLSGIRHEIGNPLNSIKITISVLKNNILKFPPPQILEYIDRALNDVNRMEELLKSLKNFNMFENLTLHDIAMHDFISNLLTLVSEDFLQRGISIIIDLQSTPTHAYADSRALQQIMLNLLANAADALFNSNKNKTIIIGFKQKINFIEISLADNGRGMTESQQANLFRPFFTSKTHGTGLGLVIVKKMVTQMNGTIDVESAENEGTTVRITLPMNRDE
jgi:signal transduction histidine kinase